MVQPRFLYPQVMNRLFARQEKKSLTLFNVFLRCPFFCRHVFVCHFIVPRRELSLPRNFPRLADSRQNWPELLPPNKDSTSNNRPGERRQLQAGWSFRIATHRWIDSTLSAGKPAGEQVRGLSCGSSVERGREVNNSIKNSCKLDFLRFRSTFFCLI